MVQRRSEPAQGERRRGTRRAAQPSGGGKFALVIVFGLLAAALALYFATAEKPVQAEPVAVPADPFADLPPEPPPEKQAKTKGQLQKEAQEEQQR